MDAYTNETSSSASSMLIFGFRTSRILLVLFTIYIVFTAVFTLTIRRLLRALTRSNATTRTNSAFRTQQFQNATLISHRTRRRNHLLIVLGSGGHTSEMLSILENLGGEYLNTRFSRRTWVVSSGDGFSAERASTFERTLSTSDVQWDIVTVTRARRVHQPLYTTPWSAMICLWECIRLLRTGTPDLILTNGPGTGVIVVLASLLLLVFGLAPLEGDGSMRAVYVESWARVKTLSLSGKMLRSMVARFLVQWRGLADDDATVLREEVNDAQKVSLPRRIEYIGAVVT